MKQVIKRTELIFVSTGVRVTVLFVWEETSWYPVEIHDHVTITHADTRAQVPNNLIHLKFNVKLYIFQTN